MVRGTDESGHRLSHPCDSATLALAIRAERPRRRDG